MHVYTEENVLNIDSDILDTNENYFVSTNITDFISLEIISASDVKMTKSAIADVGDFPLMVPLCNAILQFLVETN